MRLKWTAFCLGCENNVDNAAAGITVAGLDKGWGLNEVTGAMG
jgi:hypothetical protein